MFVPPVHIRVVVATPVGGVLGAGLGWGLDRPVPKLAKGWVSTDSTGGTSSTKESAISHPLHERGYHPPVMPFRRPPIGGGAAKKKRWGPRFSLLGGGYRVVKN